MVIAGGDDLQVTGLATAPRQVDQALAGITRSFTILTPVPGESLRVQTAAPEKVFVGVSWFPEWMSLQKP